MLIEEFRGALIQKRETFKHVHSTYLYKVIGQGKQQEQTDDSIIRT